MKTPLLILAALSVCLASCASVPQAPAPKIKFLTRDRVEQHIIKGRTTKGEVIAEFGSPNSETVSSSTLPGMPYEMMVYSKVYLAGEAAVLMVNVDKNGVVTGYTFTGTGPLTQGMPHLTHR